MKLFLLLSLLLPAAAHGKDGVTVRVYSLHKLQAVSAEPADAASAVEGRAAQGAGRFAVRGQQVVYEGRPHAGPARSLRASGGFWLSGKGLQKRLYRGDLVFSADKGRLRIVLHPRLEEYIAGVVSDEASDFSEREAYKAQAVAARTYTVKHYRAHSAEGHDLCDSTHCQFYTGDAAVRASARAAAAATAGELLYYRGAPAETYYHSACGGRTEEMTRVWPFTPKPYLVSVRDSPPGLAPYCSIAPGFRWKTKIYYTGLTRLGRQAGWLVSDEDARGFRITAWGPSGRATELEITTQRRKVRVPATEFYHGIGRRAGWNAIKSSLFRVLNGRDYVLLDGTGSGHGVGLCQWGAEGMARKGYNYREILSHYYPGTEIRK